MEAINFSALNNLPASSQQMIDEKVPEVPVETGRKGFQILIQGNQLSPPLWRNEDFSINPIVEEAGIAPVLIVVGLIAGLKKIVESVPPSFLAMLAWLLITGIVCFSAD
jgi:hypothetical protein